VIPEDRGPWDGGLSPGAQADPRPPSLFCLGRMLNEDSGSSAVIRRWGRRHSWLTLVIYCFGSPSAYYVDFRPIHVIWDSKQECVSNWCAVQFTAASASSHSGVWRLALTPLPSPAERGLDVCEAAPLGWQGQTPTIRGPVWSAYRSACSLFLTFSTVFHVRVACYLRTCQTAGLDCAGEPGLNSARWNCLQKWILAGQVDMPWHPGLPAGIAGIAMAAGRFENNIQARDTG
jgi:hypothetical protein